MAGALAEGCAVVLLPLTLMSALEPVTAILKGREGSDLSHTAQTDNSDRSSLQSAKLPQCDKQHIAKGFSTMAFVTDKVRVSIHVTGTDTGSTGSRRAATASALGWLFSITVGVLPMLWPGVQVT